MVRINGKGNAVLLSLTLITFAAYAVVLVTAFWDLPLDIPTWHQLLLLYAHFIPMFFLELLLCRTAKLKWRILLPAVLLAVPSMTYERRSGRRTAGKPARRCGRAAAGK